MDRVFDAIVPRAVGAVDPDDLIERVDVDQLVERLDVDRLMARVDIDALLARVDIDALIQRVDVDGLVQRVDVDALIQRVDVDALIQRVDVDGLIQRVDIAGLVHKAGIDQIVSDAATGVAARTLDAFRRQLHRIDRTLLRIVDRLLGRGRGRAPLGGGDRAYAGPLARTLGFIADTFAITLSYSVTLLLITSLVGLFTRNQFTIVDDGGPLWGLALLGWWFVYLAGSIAVAGRTIGKGLVGLCVQAPDGSRPSTPRAVVRTIAFPFSFVLGLGFVPAIVGRRKRALHDLIAGTEEVVWWPERTRTPASTIGLRTTEGAPP